MLVWYLLDEPCTHLTGIIVQPEMETHKQCSAVLFDSQTAVTGNLLSKTTAN